MEQQLRNCTIFIIPITEKQGERSKREKKLHFLPMSNPYPVKTFESSRIQAPSITRDNAERSIIQLGAERSGCICPHKGRPL